MHRRGQCSLTARKRGRSGACFTTNTVTVNSQATYRKGEYFRKEVAVPNSSSAVWKSVAVAFPGETTQTRSAFIPKTPQNFQYDPDGNLTSDGQWIYTWDAENRLLRMVSSTAVGPQQRIDFVYDWQGRRIAKRVWSNTAGTGDLAADLRFVYDGWNLLAELNATNNAVVRSYAWGLDLSGSMQGAGGVGGLLWINDSGSASTHCVAYDGNGNVAALVNATTGVESARYEYGPFGELLRATGPACGINPFRFSTKYQDDETDLFYYGYRYYSASTGRWISRDPIGELGFVLTSGGSMEELEFAFLTDGEYFGGDDWSSLYAFAGNDSINHFDFLGLKKQCTPFTLSKMFYHKPPMKPTKVEFKGKICWDCDNSNNDCKLKDVELFETLNGKDKLISSLDVSVSASAGPFGISLGMPKLEAEIKAAAGQPANVECPSGQTGQRTRAEVEVRLVQSVGVSGGPISVGLPPMVWSKTTVRPECVCCCWKEWPPKKK